MSSNKPTAATPSHNGTSVSVPDAAAAKILDDILRKPNARRGATPERVQSKRKMIGYGSCRPSLAVVMTLRDNGLVEEFCSALRTLLNPGDVRFEPLPDIARHVTKAERTIAEPFEELFSGRASTRDMSVIRHTAHLLRDECEQLEEAAAHTMYVAPAQRSA